MFSRKPVEDKFKPPATLPATFAEAWDIARARYNQKNPAEPSTIAFDVVEPMADWVKDELRPQERRYGKGEVYANALMLGAFSLIAGHRGETPFLVTPDRMRAEVTLASEFQEYQEGETNSAYRIAVPPAVFAVDSWVRFHGGKAEWGQEGGGGPKTSELVHSGMYFLGAMTLLPAGTALVVVPQNDGGPSRYYRPNINVAGAPPFPHDVAVATLPFIPPARREQ